MPDQYDTCPASSGFSFAGLHFPGTFAQTGEDRTLSVPDRSKMMDSPRLEKALKCGYNLINVDFLARSAGAQPGSARPGFPVRRFLGFSVPYGGSPAGGVDLELGAQPRGAANQPSQWLTPSGLVWLVLGAQLRSTPPAGDPQYGTGISEKIVDWKSRPGRAGWAPAERAKNRH